MPYDPPIVEGPGAGGDGAPGATGPIGATGAAGATGPTGATGAASAANVDSVWRVVNTGTGGSFDFNAACEDGFGGLDAVTVAWDDDEATIQSVAGNDVTIVGDADDFTVTFIGPLGAQPIELSVDESLLTGGTATPTLVIAGTNATDDRLTVHSIIDDPRGRSFNEDSLARNLKDMDEQIVLLEPLLPVGMDVNDADFEMVFNDPAPLNTYHVIYTGLSAPRVVTLPDQSFGNINDHLMLVVSDSTGECDGTNTITIQRAGTDSILNGAAGPSPANSIVLGTPYATVILMAPNQGQWLIVSRGPVA